MAANLENVLSSLGYSRPIPSKSLQAAFEFQGTKPILRYVINYHNQGFGVTSEDLRGYDDLVASGTVLEDPLLSDALVAMVHDAESARAEDARVSLEIDDLELQLAAARKSAEQLELRHRILQTALGRSRHATSDFETSNTESSLVQSSREGCVKAGRQLDDATRALDAVIHRAVDLHSEQKVTSSSSRAPSASAHPFAAAVSLDTLNVYFNEALEKLESELRNIEEDNEKGEDGRAAELARLRKCWELCDMERVIAEVQHQKAVAVNRCLTEQLTSSIGGSQIASFDGFGEEVQMAHSEQELRRLAQEVGALEFECATESATNQRRASAMDRAEALMTAGHRCTTALSAADSELMEQLQREEAYVAGMEAALRGAAAAMGVQRDLNWDRMRAYRDLSASSSTSVIEEEALAAALAPAEAGQSTPLPAAVAHLATTASSSEEGCVRAHEEAQRAEVRLDDMLRTLTALRDQPDRSSALQAMQVLYHEVQQLTSSIADIQDYKQRHMSLRSPEERAMWPLLFTDFPKFSATLRDLESVAQAQGSLAQYF